MRATGIVRSIDDLGRLVVPKEIRRVTGAVDNQPYEIFICDNGDILLRKYEYIGEEE
jgi:AbrB family transcriptional regulator (stage V sporulation protein T)